MIAIHVSLNANYPLQAGEEIFTSFYVKERSIGPGKIYTKLNLKVIPEQKSKSKSGKVFLLN